MSLIRKILIKLKKGGWFPFYNSFYENVKLDRTLILLESRGGNALEGNILCLCRELLKENYKDFKLVLSVKKGANVAVRRKIEKYGLKNLHLVKQGSISYYYYLAKAGYLVNDTSFPGRFIKKEGQCYLNTWHGTPLKCMGKDNKKEIYSMGNVMRNLLQADYLVFPNSYMEEKMVQAYQLENLYQGIILREGYPRNSVFFSEEVRKQVRQEMAWDDKQILVYMPTFRGNVENPEGAGQVEELLQYLDTKLTEQQMLYVKLHPLMKTGTQMWQFCHIQVVPAEYDINEFLNAADVLITDYSSVFYDYALTDKPIILFTQDEAKYRTERGIYEAVEDYPFEIVQKKEELLEAVNKCVVRERRDFRQRYGTYEKEKAAENICRHVFLKENACTEQQFAGNGKKNILIYAGDLDKNGITTALLSMLQGLDLQACNYYISFRKSSLEKAPERLEVLPKACGVIPIASEMNMDIYTMLVQMLYLHKGWRKAWIVKRMDKSYQREWKKHYGRIEFHHVIHYNGYERYMIALMQRFQGKRTIWVHNNMCLEIREKGNQNKFQLQDAYREYDNVIVVSEDIVSPTRELGGKHANIQVIGNCHNYQSVLQKAEQEIEFDENTEANISLEELKAILDSSVEKFINIGRYSVEKGHQRLIAAFERYWLEHTDTYLIIIGGTGLLYPQTLQWAKESKAAEHILLLKSLKNPMPILKKCQLFILSSLYEGLGLVMLEADTLGVPVISCNVIGPSGFLKENGGTLVEDSAEGIYQGMLKFSDGQVACMNVDYEEMNRNHIRKCEELWSNVTIQ